jgi:hypothetical protein
MDRCNNPHAPAAAGILQNVNRKNALHQFGRIFPTSGTVRTVTLRKAAISFQDWSAFRSGPGACTWWVSIYMPPRNVIPPNWQLTEALCFTRTLVCRFWGHHISVGFSIRI